MKNKKKKVRKIKSKRIVNKATNQKKVPLVNNMLPGENWVGD
jgi:hypothetical protein